MKVKIQLDVAKEYVEALENVTGRKVSQKKLSDAMVLILQQWLEDVRRGEVPGKVELVH